ncbi:MAG: hypothetical protein QM831_18185 [Kofleriaceae bacterium]
MVKIASLVLGLSTVAIAGTPPASKPGAKCPAAEYRQLDFWLGDWDTFEVVGDTGTSIARAHIDLGAGGCAIHELYEQTDGLVGESISSFDPVRKMWQQTWVTNGGSLLVIAGTFKDGVMTLEGENHTAKGEKVMLRATWKKEGEGVREAAVTSKDGGKTWDPYFDVRFKKHK